MKTQLKKGNAWRLGYEQGYKEGKAEENEDWRSRKRCSICGNEMKPQPLTDTCENCFEEE